LELCQALFQLALADGDPLPAASALQDTMRNGYGAADATPGPAALRRRGAGCLILRTTVMRWPFSPLADT